MTVVGRSLPADAGAARDKVQSWVGKVPAGAARDKVQSWVGKVPAGAARDKVQSWVGKVPAGGHGDPLQDSCLENLMDRGGWRATVRGVAKSQT